MTSVLQVVNTKQVKKMEMDLGKMDFWTELGKRVITKVNKPQSHLNTQKITKDKIAKADRFDTSVTIS